MNLDFRYTGRSGMTGGASDSRLALATNQLREATYFRGVIGNPLILREGLAALYAVVVSDFKFRPRARVEYRAWLEAQDRLFVSSLGARSLEAKQRMAVLQARTLELDALRAVRRKPFDAAKARWMAYAVTDAIELNRVLDPVITVHPDQLSFEAFSRDQSSYARLGVSHAAFARIDEMEYGTTNIDFSAKLHDHLDRLRSYRSTRFDIGAGGFASERLAPLAHDTAALEKRIELPQGWLEGFLRVHGLMSMGLTRLRLATIDVLNVLNFLAAHKTRESPRALRFELRPGEPVRIVLEPWNRSFWCSPSSTYAGDKIETIRIWGRERLRTLLRVLPIAQHVDVYLSASGLPSVWVCQLPGNIEYTLALSGWTDNDWVEGEARFDLLTRRLPVTAAELDSVYTTLRAQRWARTDELAAGLGLGLEKTRSALSILCQAGRAMVDLSTAVVRHRDLLLEPFVASKALATVKQHEVADPKAKAAQAAFAADSIRIIARRPVAGGYKLSGNAADGATRVRPLLHVNAAGEILEAACTCAQMQRDGLAKGPCEHVLTLRLAHMARLQQEDGHVS
jgi:hypothetical protein